MTNEAKKTVTNTTRRAQEDPAGELTMAMLMGGSEPIVHQEAVGQKGLVESDTLPSDMGEDDRKALEASGVQFGNTVEGDELFTYVTLPDGWKKEPTDHPMHSKLVDDKGRTRAMIFYKAAHYDRRAFLTAASRFAFDYSYEPKGYDIKAKATDAGKTIHEVNLGLSSGDPGVDWERTMRARDQVKDWLDKNRPGWRNPMAYWDEP